MATLTERMRMRHGVVTAVALAGIALAGCESGDADASDGSSTGGAAAVSASSLEETGTATLDGDRLVVELSNGPVTLAPADDTVFFVCEGEDCRTVDEATFRASVGDGDSIRVLGPNAELIGPGATELPGALWIVLDVAAG